MAAAVAVAAAAAVMPHPSTPPGVHKPKKVRFNSVLPQSKRRASVLIAVASASPASPGLASQLSKEVHARIALAASTGRLDISDCGLKELPREVLELEDLVEFSCSGNQISSLPDELGRLSNLKRLGLSGNRLQELPASIGNLRQLEGLWVHGNLLHALPTQIGELKCLKHLALAGNRLSYLPETISGLVNLKILSVAGNDIQDLPSDIGKLKSLLVLAAHGNQISSVPPSLTRLSELQDLWLQSNLLSELPSDWSGLHSLKQISLADNLLTTLPDSLGALEALETLWLYSNKISEVPRSLRRLTNRSCVWLENNPLNADALRDFLPEVRHLKTIGISSNKKHCTSNASNVSISYRAGTGAAATCGGYFKLQNHSDDTRNPARASVVVVAFGSAPGVPNWAGILKKVKVSLKQDGIPPLFDVLYVVDSARSWYTHHQCPKTANGMSRLGSYYVDEVEEAVRDYTQVITLGDSMGATGALMVSHLATAVLAFCPQIDLKTSSLRPGRDSNWLSSFTEELLLSISNSSADISVHCGSWSHDLEQAKLLPSSRVKIVKYAVDDHRVAKVLESNGQLLRVLQSSIRAALEKTEDTIVKA